MQIILLQPLGIWGNCGAFNTYPPLFDRVGSVNSHLVAGLIPVGQAQIIVYRFKFHKWMDQRILDGMPEDTGHFVAVHLYDGVYHLDLFHVLLLMGGVVVHQAAVRNDLLFLIGEGSNMQHHIVDAVSSHHFCGNI